jgi:hypothetical protein
MMGRAGWVRALPVATLLASVLFSLVVASTAREDLFYSGDGGVKFALTRQFARGELHADLRLPAEPWVADLWAHGLYPFEPPFAYEIDGRRYLKDPVFFPLVTAPLLAAFGWPGLYVLPVVSLWAVWIAFLLLARLLQVGPVTSSLALAAIVFASPLTLYGAMYWEHTLAVALSFGGIALLAADGDARGWRCVAGGALVALSAWFRSEHYWLVAVLALLAVASRPLGLGLRRVPLVLAGLIVPMAALTAVNLALYGHPLGPHAFQITQPLGAVVRATNAAATAWRLLHLLVAYYPLAIPAFAVAIAIAARRLPMDPERPGTAAARLLAWTSLLYVVLVPAILPRPETGGDGGKQWGPRFLLVAVPMLCALAALSAPRLQALRSSALRAVAAVSFAAAFAMGAYRNAWAGTRELERDYAGRMRPLLEFIRSDPARVVAASEQFAAQEMIALADDRRFFFVKSPEDLERLGVAALRNGQGRFLLLSSDVVQGAGPIRADADVLFLSITPIARYGWRHVAHDVRVSRSALNPHSQPAAR